MAVLAGAAVLLVAALLVAATVADQLRAGSSDDRDRALASTSVAEEGGDAAASPPVSPQVVPPPGPAPTTTTEPDGEEDAPAESQDQDPGADRDPEPATEPESGPEPPSEATGEPAPDTGAQPASADRATQLASAVTDYYALMPEDTEAAWTRMTPDYQTNHAGGRGSYEDFWADVADVTVSDVEATPPDQVVATLTYYFHSGRVDVERTAYRLVDDGGVLKIAATEVLSSRSG